MSQLLVGRLMSMNPIFAREFRSRWRRPLTYIIVLGYSVVWSWLAWQLYLTQQAGQMGSMVTFNSPLPGRALFTQTSWLQMILWAIIAPLLTAPSITSERERHMLTELLFSPLTSRNIVRGKFFSSVVFVFVMLAVPLPITALCFQMGGVSPGEFLLAFVLQAAVAISGVAVGIMCSSWTRKTSTALGAAFSLGIAGAFALGGMMAWSPAFNLIKILILVSCLMVIAIIALKRSEEAVEMAVTEVDRWVPHCLNEAEKLMLSPAAIIPAPINNFSPGQQAVSESWLQANRQSLQTMSLNGTGPEYSRHDAPEKELIEEAIEVPGKGAIAETSLGGSSFYMANAPFGWMTRWIESNPLIQREWRVRWRSAFVPDLAENSTLDFEFLNSPMMLKISFIAGCALAYGLHGVPSQLWWYATLLLIVGGSSFCAINASMAFIRERDQSMLTMLLLTRLSPREIVWGKQSIPLVMVAVYSLPFAMMLFGWGLAFGTGIALGGLLLVLSTLWCASACGIFFSWICRHTTLATIGTLGAFALIFLMTPPTLQPGMPRALSGLAWLFDGPNWNSSRGAFTSSDFLIAAFQQSTLMALIGAALLFVVERGIRPAMLDGESRSILHTDLSKNMT